MKKYDWKNEYNPIRRTAKRLLSGEVLTDGRPLSDLIELDEHTRKCLAFEATLTDRQIDMLQELGYQNIDKLTRDVLIELVDRIVIYEGGNISIVFRFADELRRIQDYIEVNTPNEAV